MTHAVEMFVALAAVLACLPAPFEPHSISSANGAFTVELTEKAMILRSGKNVRWQVTTSDSLFQKYVVSNDGNWVAVLHDPVSRGGPDVALTIYDRAGAARSFTLDEVIGDEEDVARLPLSSCGVHWVRNARIDKGALFVDVEAGPFRRPTEPEGPTFALQVELATAKFQRAAHERVTIAELIAAHRKGERGALHELRFVSSFAKNRGDRTLCEFMGSLLSSPPAEREVAIEALTNAQCTAQLATLSGPRGDQSDLAQLAWLERTDQAAAVTFAMTTLRQHSGPPLLRQRAVIFVIEHDAAQRVAAARLAIADSDAAVRNDAINSLSRQPLEAASFAVLLENTAAPPARYAILEALRASTPTWREAFLAAAEQGKLDGWPAVFVVLGGVRELQNRPTEAKLLYEKGAARLRDERDRQTGGGSWWLERELWCEATLRLSQLAADGGDAARSAALATDVRAELDRGGEFISVAAPDPNRYAKNPARWSRSAREVARAIIEAKGAPVAPPPDPAAQINAAKEQMRMIREMQEQFRKRQEQQNQKQSSP
ncbi:MAG: hypothetical protein QM817_04205 [Archangium sp.]